METLASINYNRIYKDLLTKKYPEKLDELKDILKQDTLSEFDVLFIDKTISPDHYGNSGKQRSYCKTTILKILDYQSTHALNNTQLAQHFDVSRNTIAKWRCLFI